MRGVLVDWVVVGIISAFITVAITAGGLRAQRARPERKWPIVAVGLLAGLVAGLAIIQAIWLGDRYPARRKLIDGLTVLVAGGIAVAAAYYVYGPPFGVGTQIESGRIARPDQGYAITLPRDWRVEDVSEATELFGETVEFGIEPELLALSDGGDSVLMLAIVDMGERVRRGAFAFSSTSELRADPLLEDVNWEGVELAGYAASRIDATVLGFDDEPAGAPMQMSVYIATEDERVYQLLYFYGATAPVDRWLSIAETLEYT